jgi:hypothetical protein
VPAEAVTTTSAVIWILDKSKLLLLFLVCFFAGSAAGFHLDGFQSHNYEDNYYPDFDDPREALTDFVAPFLLIAVLFQRGYEKALSFSWADDKKNQYRPMRPKDERRKIRKFSLIMALATAGMIVPTPWFQIIRIWVANLFSLIGILFFAAIFIAFLYVVWKGLS